MHQSVIRNMEIVIRRSLALGSKLGNLGDIREHSLLTIVPTDLRQSAQFLENCGLN
jgi:hypothetical protein